MREAKITGTVKLRRDAGAGGHMRSNPIGRLGSGVHLREEMVDQTS